MTVTPLVLGRHVFEARGCASAAEFGQKKVERKLAVSHLSVDDFNLFGGAPGSGGLLGLPQLEIIEDGVPGSHDAPAATAGIIGTFLSGCTEFA